MENRIIQHKVDAFSPINGNKLLENIPVIKIKPKMDNFSDWITDEDVARIKEYRLDAIIQLGFGILKGNILNSSKSIIYGKNISYSKKQKSSKILYSS